MRKHAVNFAIMGMAMTSLVLSGQRVNAIREVTRDSSQTSVMQHALTREDFYPARKMDFPIPAGIGADEGFRWYQSGRLHRLGGKLFFMPRAFDSEGDFIDPGTATVPRRRLVPHFTIKFDSTSMRGDFEYQFTERARKLLPSMIMMSISPIEKGNLIIGNRPAEEIIQKFLEIAVNNNQQIITEFEIHSPPNNTPSEVGLVPILRREERKPWSAVVTAGEHTTLFRDGNNVVYSHCFAALTYKPNPNCTMEFYHDELALRLDFPHDLSPDYVYKLALKMYASMAL